MAEPIKQYRYLVVDNRELNDDTRILSRHENEDSVYEYVANLTPRDVLVYELKYSVENVLSRHRYEGGETYIDEEEIPTIPSPSVEYRNGSKSCGCA